jgi:Zn-dependent protease with chaperone function
MTELLRIGLHSVLCLAVVLTPAYSLPALAAPAALQEAAGIDPLLRKSYLELLQLAPTVNFTRQQFDQVRKRLKEEQKQREKDLENQQKRLQSQIKEAQEQLKKVGGSRTLSEDEIAARRHNLHCQIQAWQAQLADLKIAQTTGVPVEYDNLNAKVDLLEKWPATKAEINRAIESGQIASRKWGDLQDIGFRTIEENQADDIKDGQEAVQQMKQMGILPKPIEDAEINEYVNRVAQNIARSSDLQVPLQVTLLNSKEINAFALPGGFLFLNHGLLLEAQSEAQFAGVIAHELSHHVARHGHRLLKKATIASIIYQAAQLGALIFTGGVVGIGTYYALTYGFQGLGLFLSLQLLGVSRDFEMEADLLGVQYLWKAGYNTEGFIEFFDIMASKEGYVEKTSWFRTHPAFYDRIVNAYREISFLPRQETAVDNTKEFETIKARLQQLDEELEKEDENRPTLFQREKGCEGQPDGGAAPAPAAAVRWMLPAAASA